MSDVADRDEDRFDEILGSASAGDVVFGVAHVLKDILARARRGDGSVDPFEAVALLEMWAAHYTSEVDDE